MADIDKIMAALCAEQGEEKELEASDAECGFEYSDPEDDYYDDDTSDYDNWYDDTYNSEDEARDIDSCIETLQRVSNLLWDEDRRYYEDEYYELESIVQELAELVEKVRDKAYNYTTYN